MVGVPQLLLLILRAVLGMSGLHLPRRSGVSPFLDVQGGVALGCHPQDEASEAAWPYHDVSRWRKGVLKYPY